MKITSKASNRVPFVDLVRHHKPFQPAFAKILQTTVKESGFILAPSVTQFEDAFAAWTGSRFAVGLASGTDALHLALRATGVGPGDEVIIPAMTFAATALAVMYAGATPVTVDVRPSDGLIDPSAAEKAITPLTKAIIPVHLYGKPCDLITLKRIADTRGIKIIEDACQAHGALLGKRKAGTLGAAGCFSFYPSKNLGALGDGGMLVTDDPVIYESVRMLRNYGQRIRYHHDSFGFNSRLDGLQAAFLSAKLPHVDGWNELRRKHARHYLKGLRGLPIGPMGHDASETNDHIFHLFVVRTHERDALQSHLTAAGIETGIHYPFAVHQLGFAKGHVRATSAPEAERLATEGLSLPIFPEMTSSEVDRVIQSIKTFFAKKSGRRSGTED